MATMQVQITSEKLFKLICDDVKDPVWMTRFMAHIRAVTGKPHNSLPLFQENGEEEQTKIALYRECIKAYHTKNPGLLKGGAPAGQVEVLDEERPDFVNRPRLIQPQEDAPRLQPEPEPDIGKQLIELLNRGLRPHVEVPKPEVDEAKVREIVDEIVGEKIAALPPPPPRMCIEVRDGGTVREVDGVAHYQLPQVVAWMQAGVPLWLWGAAGAGKSHLFYQVCKVLGLDGGLLPCDETLTVAKLVGYRNLVNGEFVEGLLCPRYRNGGIQGLDEVDVSAPSIACVNSLISNQRYLFPSGETVEKHADWRCLAFANTKGTGPVAGYTARNRLDAATLDRFAVIELKYDSDLEYAISMGKPPETPKNKPWSSAGNGSGKALESLCHDWVAWVQAVREYAGRGGSASVLVSPRASINGVKALRVGIPVVEVADALVFKLCAKDTIETFKRECPANWGW